VDPDPFRRLVADMRIAQREYFRTRSTTAMEHAKALEKRVDAALRESGEQPRLFPMDS
jgi:hypothetical protein